MPRRSIAASSGRLNVFLLVAGSRSAKNSAQDTTYATTGISPVATIVVVTTVLAKTCVIALHETISERLRRRILVIV